MKRIKSGLSGIFLLFVCLIQAQSPYRLQVGKEIAFTGVGLSTSFLGAQFRSGVQIYSGDELLALDPSKINSFDRNTVNYYSLSAHRTSNVFLFTGIGCPILFLAGKETRNSFGTIAVMWSETIFITSGLTLMTKHIANRTRPFVYNPDVEVRKKRTVDARASFFSGHTSLSAAGCFFAATVFSNYYPDSKWKPVVWGAAATIPAVTGYMRVRAGRHFPTDVMAGYAVGALVGWAVPTLHKRVLRDERLGFQVGPSLIALSWNIR